MFRVGATSFVILLLAACGGARGPAVHALLCVQDETGLAALRDLLRQAAADEGLRFVDMSTERLAGLRAVGHSLEHLRDPNHYFEVWGDGGFGAGFTATNVGLSSFEISIGFGGGGEDQSEAVELGRNVIARFPQHWSINLIPPDKGALPTGECPVSE